MEMASYKAAVHKTLSIKKAKVGLRHIARATARTNVAQSIIGFNACIGDFLDVSTPYILGFQITTPMRTEALKAYSQAGYYLVMGGKCLKCKFPTASKKVKLQGMTRTAAMLKLSSIAKELLKLHSQYFDGVKTAPPVTPTDSAKDIAELKEMVAKEQEDDDATRMSQFALLFQDAISLYWAICFDMFGVPPSAAFDVSMDSLSSSKPEGFFTEKKKSLKVQELEVAHSK